MSEAIKEAEKILKQYYGYDHFREGQIPMIKAVLGGRDVLGIMPTGAGKSVCYQVPALMMEGITIVISPLISLMKDQVGTLNQMGVHAAFLNSSLTAGQYYKALQLAKQGRYKIIYVAPERLETESFLDFALSEHVKISFVAVDEAHCVSQWGQDFRPGYLKILDFLDRLPYRPVVGAYTATATAEVREDILDILKLQNPYVETTGFDRGNLFFAVKKPVDKYKELVSYLKEKGCDTSGDSGIIYCLTRKSVEQVCYDLRNEGFSVTRYHAGLSDEERKENQENFIYGKRQIMVATNAFGMGIDKPDVRFVIHYNMPKNMESYYQEAGRAGRDGEPSECILYYEPRDVRTNRLFIENGEENSELDEETRKIVKERDLERLKQMTFYCFTSECLRQYILNYFGEKSSSYCGNCLNCQTQFEEVDITLEANTILRCLDALDWNYGAATVIDIVHGGKSQKILGKNLDKNPEYAVLSERTVPRLRQILRELQFREYVEEKGEQYPVICLTPEGKAFMKTEEPLIMKLPKEETEKKSESKEKKNRRKKGSVAAELTEKDAELFESLRELRREIASEEKGEQYPVICLTPEGKAFMETEELLVMKLPKEETEKKSESKEKKNRRKKGAVAAELSEKDAELFKILRELRREIAAEEKVPPYMVFADKTLAGMCVMRPATLDEMLEVSGVGEHKLEKYGDRFLEILRKG